MPQQPQHVRRAFDDVAARPVNALHAGVAEEIIILRGDDAAGDDFDVAAACFAQALISSGISVLWPAARLDAPTTSTWLSSARTTVSSGVWNNGPETMSKPISPNAEAITFAPRSCPSCPILATSSLGLRPRRRSTAARPRPPAPSVCQIHRRCRKCPSPALAGAIAAKDRLHRVGYFAERRACAGCIDGEGEQVSAALCPLRQRRQRRLTRRLIALARILARRAIWPSRTLSLSTSSVSS